MPMPAFNAKISISSGNFNIALLLYTTTREDLQKRFGKDAIVLEQFNDKKARNGLFYGDFFIYIPDNLQQQKNTSEGSTPCPL